jgi:hypothetical protein
MRLLLVSLLIIPACAGCTTTALSKYTLEQIGTVGELRDREVMHCLAQVAADPDALPSFAVSSDGTTRITDTASIGGITTWTRAVNGFAGQTAALNVNRSPLGVWTVDTVGDFERLAALRCACLWALLGAPPCDCTILDDPERLPNGKPHFGVSERLSRLPGAWVHVGKLTDVPVGARYKSHCGETWVWVMPECAEAFAQFELAMIDIALLDYQTIYMPRLLVTLVRDDSTKLKDVNEASKNQAVSIQEIRAVKLEYRQTVEDALRKAMREGGKTGLTYADWLEYTEPYHFQRTIQQPMLAPLSNFGGTSFQLNPHAPARTIDRSNRSYKE